MFGLYIWEVGNAPARPPRAGFSGLLGVWISGGGAGSLAYLVVEGAGEEASQFEQVMAVAFFAAPFFLLIHTLLTLWPRIRGHARGLGLVWAAGAAGLALLSFADGGAAFETSSVILLCRLLALLGPGLLALVTLAWLIDRWSRGPA